MSVTRTNQGTGQNIQELIHLKAKSETQTNVKNLEKSVNSKKVEIAPLRENFQANEIQEMTSERQILALYKVHECYEMQRLSKTRPSSLIVFQQIYHSQHNTPSTGTAVVLHLVSSPCCHIFHKGDCNISVPSPPAVRRTHTGGRCLEITA